MWYLIKFVFLVLIFSLSSSPMFLYLSTEPLLLECGVISSNITCSNWTWSLLTSMYSSNLSNSSFKLSHIFFSISLNNAVHLDYYSELPTHYIASHIYHGKLYPKISLTIMWFHYVFTQTHKGFPLAKFGLVLLSSP